MISAEILIEWPEKLFDPLPRLRLRLDRDCDRQRPCCQGFGVIQPGTTTHAYGLRCADCERHLGWIKRAAAAVLRDLAAEGRMTAETTLRENSVRP